MNHKKRFGLLALAGCLCLNSCMLLEEPNTENQQTIENLELPASSPSQALDPGDPLIIKGSSFGQFPQFYFQKQEESSQETPQEEKPISSTNQTKSIQAELIEQSPNQVKIQLNERLFGSYTLLLRNETAHQYELGSIHFKQQQQQLLRELHQPEGQLDQSSYYFYYNEQNQLIRIRQEYNGQLSGSYYFQYDPKGRIHQFSHPFKLGEKGETHRFEYPSDKQVIVINTNTTGSLINRDSLLIGGHNELIRQSTLRDTLEFGQQQVIGERSYHFSYDRQFRLIKHEIKSSIYTLEHPADTLIQQSSSSYLAYDQNPGASSQIKLPPWFLIYIGPELPLVKYIQNNLIQETHLLQSTIPTNQSQSSSINYQYQYDQNNYPKAFSVDLIEDQSYPIQYQEQEQEQVQ